MSQNIRLDIPYGDRSLPLTVPRDGFLGVLENKDFSPKSADKLLLKALRHKEFPFRKKKFLIVVPDATRSAHLREVLPILLKKITVPSRSVDIMVATGMHKAHTPGQLAKLLGPPIVKRYKIMQHDPSEESCVNFGRTKYDVPAALDKALFNYDFLISIGVIEPHLYAGYSGGAKTIAIGLAGAATINATHGIKFLDDPATKIGVLEGNPFQETLWHILDNIGPVFSINTVNNPDGKPLKVFSGLAKEVFKKGTDFAKKVFEVEAGTKCDIAICGIGYPKDVNLYQASRAINYIVDVDRPVVKKGGVVIVAAELKDGVGNGPAEQRFYEELKKMRLAPRDLVGRVKTRGCVAGEHRAYMVARALMDYKVIFVTNGPKAFMEGLPFKCCGDISGALDLAQNITGKDSKIYVIPRSLATIANINSA